MTDSIFTQMEALRHSWSRTVTSMLWGQWVMLDTGFQATQMVLARAAPVAGAGANGIEQLVALALERAKNGLAPPREVYLAPCRDRIDWAAFPAWARPSDPEVFDGCAHEG